MTGDALHSPEITMRSIVYCVNLGKIPTKAATAETINIKKGQLGKKSTPRVFLVWILDAELARHGVLLNGELRVALQLPEYLLQRAAVGEVDVFVDVEEEGPIRGVPVPMEAIVDH